MTPAPWWQPWIPVIAALAGAVVGAAIGFLLSQGMEWYRRRDREKAQWAALRAEIEFCCQRAETYLRHDEPKAPLYRLPTTAYAAAFPELLRDAKVTETEMLPLMRFFTEVEDFNRGLDLAQAAIDRNDAGKIDIEISRNLLKASMLVPPPVGKADGYYQAARAILNAHLK
jgi:hypothetical protein